MRIILLAAMLATQAAAQEIRVLSVNLNPEKTHAKVLVEARPSAVPQLVWTNIAVTDPEPVKFLYFTNVSVAITNPPGPSTNAINKLAESGRFCEVRGHAWGSHAHVTLEYSPNKTGCRQCLVCGLHQTQFAEWK